MDQWTKSLREDKFQHRKNPSFSSTLLDAIYRSIDEGDEGEEELVLYRENMKKNQSSNNNTFRGASKSVKEEEMANFRQACMIEKWMEKKVSEKVVIRRKSVPDFDRKLQNDRSRSSMVFHSTSSSSDSSCGGAFSSSEAESGYGSRSRSSSLTSQKLKPVRTSASVPSERTERSLHSEQRSNIYETKQKPKHEGGFNKTKSRALKIYGDLKKVKQPISPGGRLATFLNSIFTAGSTKKAKIGEEIINSERKSKSTQTSTCSSASSFSRSCLSKTPSSRGKSINGGIKRSVRFYPVSVIVDEDCRPCGHKSLYEDDPKLMSINEELKFHLVEKNRRVEEAARDLLEGYGISRDKSDFDMRDSYQDDDDDDVASCSSSDLFELDNLSAIGIERYREELPVYETTHLATNRAIANGFIL